jgi:hypothetical protein
VKSKISQMAPEFKGKPPKRTLEGFRKVNEVQPLDIRFEQMNVVGFEISLKIELLRSFLICIAFSRLNIRS